MVRGTGAAVDDVRVDFGGSAGEPPDFFYQRVVAAVAGAMHKPHGAPGGLIGQGVEHAQHRGQADAGADQDDGAAALMFNHEITLRRPGAEDLTDGGLIMQIT